VFFSVTPALISFLAVVFLSPILIATLKKLQLTQPIRTELPSDHQVKKGTPLMAGSIFLIGILVALSYYPTMLMMILSLSFFLFSLVGFLDDYWKASKQDPAGISGKTKLIFQFIITIFLLELLMRNFGLSANLNIMDDHYVGMSLFGYLAVMTLFVVGSANAINFTDGMDGLLGMVAIPTYFFFFFISDQNEVKVFSLIMIASLVGFLLFNLYPAKAFMGDTGSLAIGGSLSILAVLEKVEILIPLLFFVYFAEQFSVILQVFFFKLTGRRIFKMSPIHYHYRIKYGWSENVIVSVFSGVSWICSLICLGYYHYFL
jgi:phospho-N-acetylmuramoyl-pentapeptide-transferase